MPVLLFVFLWTTNYEYLAGLFLPGLPRLLLAAAGLGVVVGFVTMQRVVHFEV